VNFEQLKIFITVVEQRSFTKAAKALYISHSTTSRNVSSLEETLGVRLLARDNRSVRLTPAGDILYREGIKLLKKIEVVESAVQDAGHGLSGRLNVAGVNLHSYELWGGYKEFCKKYPDIAIGIYQRGLKEVWKQTINGEVDVGITFSYTAPEDKSGCEVHKISRDSFCVVTPANHPLAARSAIKLEELAGANFISLPDMDFGFLENQKHRELIKEMAAVNQPVPTLESLLLQIRNGNGVSILPRQIAKEQGPSCAALDILDVNMGFDVLLIWRADNANPSLPLFVNTIFDRIKE